MAGPKTGTNRPASNSRPKRKVGISAAPVVDADGTLIGIVSEADLMYRAEIGTVPGKSWLQRLLADDAVLARDYIRSHSHRVADVMTKNVVTAEERASLGEIAALMQRHRVKRIPILRGGKLVGIVSRASLLQGLRAREPSALEDPAADETLRTAVAAEDHQEVADHLGLPLVVQVHHAPGREQVEGHLHHPDRAFDQGLTRGNHGFGTLAIFIAVDDEVDAERRGFTRLLHDARRESGSRTQRDHVVVDARARAAPECHERFLREVAQRQRALLRKPVQGRVPGMHDQRQWIDEQAVRHQFRWQRALADDAHIQ